MVKTYGMTGFGVGEVEDERASVRVEARSWNSKGLDVTIKGPFLLAEWELALRQEVLSSGIKRGLVKIDVFVRPRNMKYKVSINHGLWRSMQKAFSSSNISLNSEVRLSDLTSVPGLISYELERPKEVLPVLKRALKKALTALISQRAKEGQAMHQAVSAALKQVTKAYRQIEKRVYLLDKKGFFKPENIESDYKRKDVYEEVKRLKMNIDMFAKELNSSGPKGKRLDFIAQEMLREANTFMAKVIDVKLTKYALELKSNVDRIREVVQNVE